MNKQAATMGPTVSNAEVDIIERLSSLRVTAFDLKRELEDLAKLDPSLAKLVDAARDFALRVHKVAEPRELKEAEKKDAGRVLFTVFVPIMCGRGEARFSAGIREFVRTPNRLFRRYIWRTGEPDDKGQWSAEPCSDWWISDHFRSFMDLDKEVVG